jgi:hypothetical protein
MKIITHGGRTHPDELLAIALISIKENVAVDDLDILRLNYFKAGDQEADFVVDVGREHDPEKRRFDHHQFPRDHPPECALTLVAKHYEMNVADFQFMEKVAVLDSKGPYRWFEQKFGFRAKTEKQVNEALNNRESAFWFFTRLADQDFKAGLRQAKAWLAMELAGKESHKEHVEQSRCCANIIDMGSFKMIFFPKKDLRGTGEVTDEMVESDPSIIVMGMRDARSDGFSATRIADNERVDFSPRSGEKGCVFAHSTGFCLKWENNWDGFVSAVTKSVAVLDEGPRV